MPSSKNGARLIQRIADMSTCDMRGRHKGTDVVSLIRAALAVTGTKTRYRHREAAYRPGLSSSDSNPAATLTPT